MVASHQLMLSGKPKPFHGKLQVTCSPFLYSVAFIILSQVSDLPRFLHSYHCSLFLFAVSSGEEPELLEEVASIGKDAAEEATKIAAAER